MRIAKILAYPIALIILGIGLMYATDSQYLWTATKRVYLSGHDTANINDHEIFKTRQIATAIPVAWPEHAHLSEQTLPEELTNYLNANDAIAFLVAHKGELIAEQYFQSYHDRSRSNSFSMAKTVVTLLLAIAIEEGYIQGVDQPLTALLPEFVDDPLGSKASIGSLSTMSSGYEWDEDYYSAFSPTVKLLYGDDVESYLLEGKFTHEPESYYYYSSASTQLLAVSINRALKARDPTMTLSRYLSEKLWQPLGMNDDGLWHLDNSGMELAYCCINTNARNFARLGQLMLQDGQWQGEQLVPAGAIEAMRTPQADPGYGYATWVNNEHSPAFYSFRGHLGQYIIVVPEHDMIVVRLGESRRRDVDTMTEVLPFYIEHAQSLIQ